WNISGLTQDPDIGLSHYDGIIGYSTDIAFNTYFTNLTIGGFTATNLSLGGSAVSQTWYPSFGDGVLGICEISAISKLYPSFLHVGWFYKLGLVGKMNQFAIFLPKFGAGNVGELSIGGVNTARYKGIIRW
ncbi:hypothetical protein HDU76_009902, partial [Blyttiomyces sp. JEL0837]